MNILNKVLTLSLNSAWQPIGHKTVQDAMGDLFSENYLALNVDYEKHSDGSWNFNSIRNMLPLEWNDWINLEIRDFDFYVRTAKLKIRVPTILICKKYDKIPKTRMKLTKANIRKRDGGVCQYTGKKINANQGNIDHVIPVSRGGANTWNNLVYCNKEINTKKGNKLPEEAGLNLIKQPEEPNTSIPLTNLTKANHQDWKLFI